MKIIFILVLSLVSHSLFAKTCRDFSENRFNYYFEQIRKFHFDENLSSERFNLLCDYFHTSHGQKTMERIFLNETVQFIQQEIESPLEAYLYGHSPFIIEEHSSYGAIAQPAVIRIGAFRTHFPVGGQEVDPIAIIHHEFCHTKYGNFDPAYDTNHWRNELYIVRNCENPLRQANGYEPRRSYFLASENLTINIITGGVRQGRWRVSPSGEFYQ